MKALSLVLMSLFSFQAVGQSSAACQPYCDYLCRHFRSDLKPVELRLNKRNAGDFYVYTLALKVKNIGETPVGPTSGTRQLQVAASGVGTKYATFSGQVASGTSRWVGLGAVSPQKVKHCARLKVLIDGNRRFGQFGCLVHSNDKALLTVYEAGNPKPCRVLKRIGFANRP